MFGNNILLVLNLFKPGIFHNFMSVQPNKTLQSALIKKHICADTCLTEKVCINCLIRVKVKQKVLTYFFEFMNNNIIVEFET